jgi:hypothetical protein
VKRALFTLAVLAGGVVWAGAARAANVELFTVDNKTDLTGNLNGFNRDSCTSNDSHDLTLRITDLTEPDYHLRFIRYPLSGPNGPCPTDMLDPLTEVVSGDEDFAPAAGRIEINDRAITTDELLSTIAAQGTAPPEDDCNGEGARANDTLCFQLTVLPGDTTASFTAGIGLDYDTQAPPLPVAEAVASDTSIDITVTPPDDTTGDQYSYLAQYQTCGGTVSGEGEGEGGGLDLGLGEEGEGEGTTTSDCTFTGEFKETPLSTSNKFSIGGLSANERVQFRVLLQDDFGNRGPATALQTLIATDDLGPLGLYDGAGSQISCTPSCGSSTSTTTAGLFGWLLLLTRRGRRVLRALGRLLVRARVGAAGGALVVVIGVLAALPARADLGQMTISLDIAPYKPAIDTELVHPGQPIFPIYKCEFGAQTLPEIGGELDEHLFDGFGSLELSVGFDISQAKGFAQPTSSVSTRKCGTATATAVQLSFLKVRPGLTYRFDPALDKWGVPLVPYVRLGLVGQTYLFTNSGDFDKGKQNPLGERFGWEAAGGMMLALDFLDSIDPFVPDTTKRGIANGTFDHTFVFVEGDYQPVNSFNQPGFVFSPDDTFLGTGLPVLWKVGIAVELL